MIEEYFYPSTLSPSILTFRACLAFIVYVPRDYDMIGWVACCYCEGTEGRCEGENLGTGLTTIP